MFDVSDLNYVFTNGCFDISIYLFFAKLLNFIMLFTWTTFKILVVNTDSTPYFFVWVLGFLVWFFLEIYRSRLQINFCSSIICEEYCSVSLALRIH